MPFYDDASAEGQQDPVKRARTISGRLRSQDWQEHSDFERLRLEKIVGINNLLSISWLSKGLEVAASVGRILLLDGVGTGFLVSPNLLLTNHHVIPDKEACNPDTAVYFNYQTDWNGRLESSSRYELDSSQFTTDEELDYTIVAVKGSPGAIFGYVDISNSANPAVNDYVNIIQHPMGGPKQISLTDNKVSAVFGTFDPVHDGY